MLYLFKLLQKKYLDVIDILKLLSGTKTRNFKIVILFCLIYVDLCSCHFYQHFLFFILTMKGDMNTEHTILCIYYSSRNVISKSLVQQAYTHKNF
jgi:hypothetical protein